MDDQGEAMQGRRCWSYFGGKEGRPQLIKLREGGWTRAKAEKFLESFAQTANVSASARAAGMGRSAPYYLRERDAEFRKAWDEALAHAYDKLETMMLERAMNGAPRVARYQGHKVGEDIVFNETTAFNLLKMHRQKVSAFRSGEEEARDVDAIAGEIKRKLIEMRARLLGLPEPGVEEELGESGED